MVIPALVRGPENVLPVFIDGKLTGRSLGATNATSQNVSRLFYITDSSTGSKFLVDTGAQVSVIPPSPTDRHNRDSNLTLEAVNGTPIRTFGTRSLTLNLGLRRTFRWVFIIADTASPILGADFLRHYQLLVDLTNYRLVDTTTSLVVRGISSLGDSPSPTLLPRKPATPFAALLAEFPDLTQLCIRETPIKHNITHHIATTGPPVSARTCRLAPERLEIAHKEFQHMLELGIVRQLVLTTAYGP